MSLTGAAQTDAAFDAIQFNRDIRPILADKCFACHGPDADAREAELRLDEHESAIEDRGGYQVIEPGEPDDSELMVRVSAEDEYERMPPPESPK